MNNIVSFGVSAKREPSGEPCLGIYEINVYFAKLMNKVSAAPNPAEAFESCLPSVAQLVRQSGLGTTDVADRLQRIAEVAGVLAARSQDWVQQQIAEVSQWAVAGTAPPDIIGVPEHAADIGGASIGSERFKLTHFDDVTLPTSSSFLVKNLIPRTGITVVWGRPKCGKSFWTFDLAMRVALGGPYRGQKTHQGPVVYLALEGSHGFRGRIEAYRRTYGVTEAPFYLIGDRLDLVSDHQALTKAVKDQIGGTPPVLVVIDTLNRSLTGSESNDEDMAAYIRAADMVWRAFDCAVMIVHHCGHDKNRPRGHTSLTGAADAQIAVTRDAASNIIVTVEWMKDGPEGLIIGSRLENVDLDTDEDGELITSCVIVPVEGNIAQAGTQRQIKGSTKIALDLLREAIGAEGEIASASNHIPPGARIVSVETWRRYAYRGTITASEQPDARRKAFARAVAKLREANLIGSWDDHVWIAA
jgi:AAA domain